MATTKIHELPEQDRPREKLARLGAAALTDSELIAILLRTGLPGANAVDVARQLLQRFGTLAVLARCTVPELSVIKGVGPAKAVQLAAAFGLAARLAREGAEKLPMSTPTQIYALLGDELRALHHETLRVILLDTKLRLMRVEAISIGTLSETSAHPREVFRPAILHAAYGIVLVHNHPSGDPTPSDADRRFTTRLNEVGKLLQITLVDHVIIGSAEGGRAPWFSFRSVGLVG